MESYVPWLIVIVFLVVGAMIYFMFFKHNSNQPNSKRKYRTVSKIPEIYNKKGIFECKADNPLDDGSTEWYVDDYLTGRDKGKIRVSKDTHLFINYSGNCLRIIDMELFPPLERTIQRLKESRKNEEEARMELNKLKNTFEEKEREMRNFYLEMAKSGQNSRNFQSRNS